MFLSMSAKEKCFCWVLIASLRLEIVQVLPVPATAGFGISKAVCLRPVQVVSHIPGAGVIKVSSCVQ